VLRKVVLNRKVRQIAGFMLAGNGAAQGRLSTMQGSWGEPSLDGLPEKPALAGRRDA
jgi:hypothetical protein